MTTARCIAIIGTAGRDRTKPMTRDLWARMVADAKHRIAPGATLVSGGAAWADHVAVALFLDGHASGLVLHLPAPLLPSHTFAGSAGSAGSATNYYHSKFSAAIGRSSVEDIATAILFGASFTAHPKEPGMKAFFVRNAMVASEATACIAYTWGEGLEPADGGTNHTWSLIQGRKLHVPLSTL